MIELYPHQSILKNAARDQFYEHHNVLMQGATGIGKTQISASIIKDSYDKGKRIWFVVPRIELMKQVSNVFRSWDVHHSFIASGYNYNRHAQVHIVSLQSLKNRYKDITAPDFCVIDESHLGGATIDTLIKWLRDRGVYVLLLSATPARQDNFGMGDWADTMVQGPSIRWLIDNRFLSDYALVQPSIKMGRGQIGGDPIEEWLRHSGGRLTIGFCRDKIHGMKSAQEFTASGVPSGFIEAETPTEERRRLIAELAEGEIKILFNVYLCQVGFDLASQIGRAVNVRCILDLQPCGSLTTQLQKWGRGLRYDPAGHAVIIDLAGNSYSENHGYPCADREWVLDKSDQHKRDVEFRGRTENLITCRHCFRPSKVGPLFCPFCGTRFVTDSKKVRQVDGKLILITPEMLRAEKTQAKIDAGIEREAKKRKRQERIRKNRSLPPEIKKAARDRMIEGLKNKGRTAYQIGIIIEAEGLA